MTYRPSSLLFGSFCFPKRKPCGFTHWYRQGKSKASERSEGSKGPTWVCEASFFQIILNFTCFNPCSQFYAWFMCTRTLWNILLKGLMVCRETVYINPKLFVILGMALIILSTELRQKLQEGEIKDKIRVFPFIWLIGIPA